MSDAQSQIVRDQERDAKYSVYLLNFLGYLQERNDNNRGKLSDSATSVDKVRDGYFSPGSTNLREKLEKHVALLTSGNEEPRMKLLEGVETMTAMDFFNSDDEFRGLNEAEFDARLRHYSTIYEQFKELSPFKGRTFFRLEGHHWINSKGLKDLVIRQIESSGVKYEDVRDYVLAVDSEVLEQLVKNSRTVQRPNCYLNVRERKK